MSAGRGPSTPPDGEVERLRPSTRVAVGVPLALGCLLLALVSRRPELAVLAAGPVVVVAAGLVGARPPRPQVRLALRRQRAVERDEVPLRVRLSGIDAGCDVDVVARVPAGLQTTDDAGRVVDGPALVTRTARATTGRDVDLEVLLRAVRWGVHDLEVPRVRIATAAAVRTVDARRSARLVVLPEPSRLASVVGLRSTLPAAGSHRAAAVGSGVELAEIRPYTPGDRWRDVDWRTTLRDRSPGARTWVRGRHPDRAGDVIVLLDSAEHRGATVGPVLDAAVRAAVTIAQQVLRARDRVGVLGLGGRVRWLAPAGGLRQWYAIAEALVGERPAPAHPGLGLRLLPPAALGPDVTIIAVSALLDARVVDALVGLARHRRGRLVVVAVDPSGLVSRSAEPAWQAARTLWDLERAVVRRRLAAAGATVVAAEPTDDLAAAVAVAGRRPAAARG